MNALKFIGLLHDIRLAILAVDINGYNTVFMQLIQRCPFSLLWIAFGLDLTLSLSGQILLGKIALAGFLILYAFHTVRLKSCLIGGGFHFEEEASGIRFNLETVS